MAQPDETREAGKASATELTAEVGGPKSDTLPVIAWTLRGIAGGVNLLKAEVKTGRQLPDYWAGVAAHLAAELAAIAGDAPEQQP